MYELGDIEDVGRRAGMAMSFAAIGALVGPPISGEINKATGGFSEVGYYAGAIGMYTVVIQSLNSFLGSMMLLSCVMMLTTRHLVLQKFWGKF